MYPTISNWKARRAGGRITITGLDKDGAEFKVTGVDTIAAGDSAGAATWPVATDKNGAKYFLR